MEVVLALVIIAIVVLPLIGMLASALESDQKSGRDTTLVAMSSQVLNRLRAVPFDALWLADPSANSNPTPPGTALPVETIYYFSDDGALLATSPSAVPPEALFRCIVKKQPDNSSRAALGTGPCNRLQIDLEFDWSVAAPTSAKTRPNLQILHASIARY